MKKIDVAISVVAGLVLGYGVYYYAPTIDWQGQTRFCRHGNAPILRHAP